MTDRMTLSHELRMFRIGVRTQGDMIGSNSVMPTAASRKRNKMKKNCRHSYGDGLAVTGFSRQLCNDHPATFVELFVPHTAWWYSLKQHNLKTVILLSYTETETRQNLCCFVHSDILVSDDIFCDLTALRGPSRWQSEARASLSLPVKKCFPTRRPLVTLLRRLMRYNLSQLYFCWNFILWGGLGWFMRRPTRHLSPNMPNLSKL